jgi:large subunit ribosomal protein L30
MSALEVTLKRSWAGSPERQRSTIRGLGLYKINDVRILPDTPATLGMINHVGHLVTYRRLDQVYKPTGRRHTKGPGQGKKTS